MKGFKRIAGLVCAAVMTVSSFTVPVYAADSQTAIETVRALGIISGDGAGNMNLSSPVTRAEFAKMMISASVYKDEMGDESVSSLYKDVKKDHWAVEYIRVAVENGWMTGYSDGTFRPSNNIKYEEAATAVLKLLGYDPSSFAGVFPSAQISKFQSLDLDDNLTLKKGQTLTRNDCVYIFYNLLKAECADGQVFATKLGYTVDNSGNINYSSLVSGDLKGPYVYETGSILANIPFAAADAIIYRNGVRSTLSALQVYDVYYYNAALKTIWIYGNSVTGRYTAANPSTANPSTATVAGNTYTLESAAAYKLSDLGQYTIGDMVTLLLGKDGTVVDVVSTSNFSGSFVGVISSIGTDSYINEAGAKIIEDVVNVTCTDGVIRSYQTDTDKFKVGDVVSITFDGQQSTVQRQARKKINGTFNADGTKLGTHPVASKCNIINVNQDYTAAVTYTSKLAGKEILSDNVMYYVTNGSGEITDLILYDVTSDGKQFGIIVSKEEIYGVDGMAEEPTATIYNYIINGQAGTATLSGNDFSGDSGAAYFQFRNGQLIYIGRLTGITLTNISYGKASGGSKKYDVSEDVQCYVKTGPKQYQQTNLATAMNTSKYNVTGYTYGNEVVLIMLTEK
ncbi:MAG: S-layer homology domain-containing protein [Clostridia bacterium]|nr:S-layer homology domain-containing protein [Clostridia bacterium]